jgi:hypothetical protein
MGVARAQGSSRAPSRRGLAVLPRQIRRRRLTILTTGSAKMKIMCPALRLGRTRLGTVLGKARARPIRPRITNVSRIMGTGPIGRLPRANVMPARRVLRRINDPVGCPIGTFAGQAAAVSLSAGEPGLTACGAVN